MNGMTSSMGPRVEGLDLSATLPASAKVICEVSLEFDRSVVNRIKEDLAGLGQVKTRPADLACVRTRFSFHDNHGGNIALSNNKQTAERTQGNDHAIVMSRDPMEVGVLYEVTIDRWDDSCGCGIAEHLVLGVVTQPPDTLPCLAGLGTCCLLLLCGTDDCTSCPSLASLRAGDRVGVSVDSAHSLHVHVNGQDQGAFFTNLPQPCYALFDVSDYTRQITALPTTRLA